jgi:hypothetical protein
MTVTPSVERQRVDGFGRLDLGLRQASDWYLWDPYLSERQWGLPPGASIRIERGGCARRDRPRAGQVNRGDVRRQFELAWPGVVSAEPPRGYSVAAIPRVFGDELAVRGDNGAGPGESHQTGWTGLVADVIRRRHRAYPKASEVIQRLVQGEETA